MSTSVITVKIDTKTKKDFKKIAEKLGMPISSLIRGFITNLIKTRRVEYTLDEEPTQYLMDAIRESEEDIKEGRVVSFKNGKDAIKYLEDIIIKDEKREKGSLHK